MQNNLVLKVIIIHFKAVYKITIIKQKYQRCSAVLKVYKNIKHKGIDYYNYILPNNKTPMEQYLIQCTLLRTFIIPQKKNPGSRKLKPKFLIPNKSRSGNYSVSGLRFVVLSRREIISGIYTVVWVIDVIVVFYILSGYGKMREIS